MRAHVITDSLLDDEPMLGATIARLVKERAVDLVVFEHGLKGGMLAGYGPIDVELRPDPRLLSNPLERSVMGLEPLKPLDHVLADAREAADTVRSDELEAWIEETGAGKIGAELLEEDVEELRRLFARREPTIDHVYRDGLIAFRVERVLNAYLDEQVDPIGRATVEEVIDRLGPILGGAS